MSFSMTMELYFSSFGNVVSRGWFPESRPEKISRYIFATLWSVSTRFGSFSGSRPRMRIISRTCAASWSTRGSVETGGSKIEDGAIGASYGATRRTDAIHDGRRSDEDRRDDRGQRGETRGAGCAPRRGGGRRPPERGARQARGHRAPHGA